MGLLARLLGREEGHAPGPVRVGVAQHVVEAEMLVAMLGDAGIPALSRPRPGFGVGDALAAGPRDILVPARFEQEARDALAPLAGDAPPG